MLSLRIQEHRETATRAGLLYVTDGVPESTATRREGMGVLCAGRRRISDAVERRRILGLVIPPAWTDVWICPDPHGHIQATARDARGGSIPIPPLYRAARDKSKFRRMLEFSEILPEIRERVEARPARRRPDPAADPRHRGSPADKTLIRVGNDEYCAREPLL